MNKLLIVLILFPAISYGQKISKTKYNKVDTVIHYDDCVLIKYRVKNTLVTDTIINRPVLIRQSSVVIIEDKKLKP